VDFWDVHSWFFLVGIALFPRLTMLVGAVSYKRFYSESGLLAVETPSVCTATRRRWLPPAVPISDVILRCDRPTG